MMGWETGWGDDDYVVMDIAEGNETPAGVGERLVGLINIERSTAERRFMWSINTSPFPAPIPHNGLAATLDEAKRDFKKRYLEMKAQGAKFGNDG
jgi:hypothetical protein